MKKILFITGDQSQTGGTERTCTNVANMLAEEGFLVEVLSLNNGLSSHFELHTGVKLSSLALEGYSSIKLLSKASLSISRFLKNNHFDYVVVVESLLFICMMLSVLMRSKNIKIINWEHFNYDVDLGLKTRRIARWLASKFADVNVVLTQADREKWISKLKTNSQNIVQIYNLNPFDGLANRSVHLGSELNLPKIVLAAGRLTSQKGFDLVIEAWSKIKLNVRTDWVLKVVGEGEDRQMLKSMILALKLEDSVLLPGSSNEMIQAYQNCDVFVLSSRYEGFGLVLTEALSCGAPVISFNCPDGPSEIIYHNENGLLVKNGDVNALAQALETYMTDNALRAHLQANVTMGLERFSSQAILPKWLELFK
jgi:glycosyltransferase involved in cell wall biosynthesis